MSRRDSILDQIESALSAASLTLPSGATLTKPTGLNVHRQRSIPLAVDQLPAQVVYLLNEPVEIKPGMGPSRLAVRHMNVCVESRVNATAAGTTADQALDQYLRWAVAAICSDPRRATLAHDTKEVGTEWDQSEHDSALASAKTVFVVDYVTSAVDLDAAS